MEKIIESLYTMQIDGRFEEVVRPFKENKEEAFRGYQALREKLSKELAQELEAVMDDQLGVCVQEMEAAFEEGFKLGAKLMCEIFMEEKKDSK